MADPRSRPAARSAVGRLDRQAMRLAAVRTYQREAVTRIGYMVRGGLGVDDLARAVTEFVATAIDVPRCAVVEVLPDDPDHLLVRAGVGLDGVPPGSVLEAGALSLSGYTLMVGRPVVVRDLSKERRFRSRLLEQLNVASGMAVVIAGPDRTPYGALSVLADEPRVFTRACVQFLQSVAEVLGAAIQRCRAEEALAAERARLELRVAERTQDLGEANRRLRALSKRLIDLQEEERRHLARELHDEIGQSLTVIRMSLDGLAEAVGEESLAARVREDAARVDDLIAQIRALSLDLRPAMLDDLGLPAAVRWYAERVAERAGLAFELKVRGTESGLPPNIAIACFRVAQEAVTNVVRHARARRLRIAIAFGRWAVALCVRDDGIGFDPDAVRRISGRDMGVGLLGMQERAMLLGGRFRIDTAVGKGTAVRAVFPLRRRDDKKGGSDERVGAGPSCG